MKKSTSIILFCVLLLIWACSDDKDAIPQTVFKFSLINTSLGVGNELWIVVRDNDTGDLIGSKVLTGPPVTFETTTAPKKLTVSVIDATSSVVIADVYSGIDVGSDWSITTITDPGTISAGAKTGAYMLTVTDIPSLYNFGISDQAGSTLESFMPFVGSTFDANVDLHSNGAKQLLTIAPDSGNPRYTILENKSANDHVSVSYNSLKEFDKIVSMSFPTARVGLDVTGYDGNVIGPDSWSLYSNGSWGGPTTLVNKINIGFLDVFPNYVVNLSILAPDHVFRFNSVGPAPSSIDYTDPEAFKITSTDFYNYSLSTNQNYNYSQAIYTNDDVLPFSNYYVVTYHTPFGSTPKHFDPVSSEIAAKYSFLDVSQLSYQQTTVVVSGKSYDELINSSYDKNFVKKSTSTIVSIEKK